MANFQGGKVEENSFQHRGLALFVHHKGHKNSWIPTILDLVVLAQNAGVFSILSFCRTQQIKTKGQSNITTSWWLNHPIWKIWTWSWIIPQGRGWKQKMFESHHLVNYLTESSKYWWNILLENSEKNPTWMMGMRKSQGARPKNALPKTNKLYDLESRWRSPLPLVLVDHSPLQSY